MKEYPLVLDKIFSGLSPVKRDNFQVVMLSECHNLEPVVLNYNLHEEVISLNSSSYDWDNAVGLIAELESHIWEDNDNFIWEDLGTTTWTNT